MRRDGPVRQHRQRGGPAGAADRAGRRAAGTPSSSSRATTTAGSTASSSACPAGPTSRPAATSGCEPRRPARTRRRSSTPRSCPGTISTRSRRGWRSGDVGAVITEPLWRGYIRPAPGFLEGLREICSRHGDDPDLRRDRVGLPGRSGRRPGAVRGHAGPRDVRQGDGQRLRHRGRRRAARPDEPPRRRAGRPSGNVQRQRPVDGRRRGDPDARSRRGRRTRRSSGPADG